MEGVWEGRRQKVKSMPTLSRSTGTGARYFLKGKKSTRWFHWLNPYQYTPYPGPCRKPDELRIDSMVSKWEGVGCPFLFTGLLPHLWKQSAGGSGETSGGSTPNWMPYHVTLKPNWKITVIYCSGGSLQGSRYWTKWQSEVWWVHPEDHHSCEGLLNEKAREPPLGLNTQTDGFLKRRMFLSLAGDGKHSKMTDLTTARGQQGNKMIPAMGLACL